MVLMIDVIEGDMAGRQFLITWSEILSIAGDLLAAMGLTVFPTRLIFT